MVSKNDVSFGVKVSFASLNIFLSPLIIYVVCTKKALQTSANIFLCCLCCLCLIFECMDIVSYLSKRFYKEVIVFEEILLTSSPLLLSATAYARYRLVSKPYKKQISILWSLSTACLIFLYSISVAVLSSVETFYYRAIYDIASVVIRCLIPFVIITVCHIQIVRLLTQQNERIKIYKVLSSVRYAQGLRRKQRLKRLLLAILVIFLTTSCPLETVKLLVLTQCVEVDDNIRKGIELAAINGTLLTPLIYAYWNDSLKREVFKIMTSFVCKQYRKFSVSSYASVSVRVRRNNSEA